MKTINIFNQFKLINTFYFSKLALWVGLFFISNLSLVQPRANAAESKSTHPLTEQTWHLALSSRRFGPVETIVTIHREGMGFIGRSTSATLSLIQSIESSKDDKVDIKDALFAFSLEITKDGYEGTLISPWPGSKISLSLSEGKLQGTIEGGSLAGNFTGKALNSSKAREPLRDYAAIVDSMQSIIEQKIYDPLDLKSSAYASFAKQMRSLAQFAQDDLDLLIGYEFAWTAEVFSHFDFKRSNQPAEKMMAYFDELRIGKPMATVKFEDELAILTVSTMMGLDTIEYIDAAYKEIAEQGSKVLIIDLRQNQGGAFAVKPLVEHVIDKPLDAGYFLSHKWNTENDQMPTVSELNDIIPWTGWSIISFWNAVQDLGIIKVRFVPAENNFDGPIYVLTSNTTASAAEMATDALRSSGLVTIIGEKTAGKMLSQSFFDVVGGFSVILPVADYFSVQNGRIEGNGIKPDIEVAPELAMKEAKRLARIAL